MILLDFYRNKVIWGNCPLLMLMKTRDVMNGILAKHTGKTIEEINEATSFDNYMTAQQAVEFGICDKITDNVFEEVIA